MRKERKYPKCHVKQSAHVSKVVLTKTYNSEAHSPPVRGAHDRRLSTHAVLNSKRAGAHNRQLAVSAHAILDSKHALRFYDRSMI